MVLVFYRVYRVVSFQILHLLFNFLIFLSILTKYCSVLSLLSCLQSIPSEVTTRCLQIFASSQLQGIPASRSFQHTQLGATLSCALAASALRSLSHSSTSSSSVLFMLQLFIKLKQRLRRAGICPGKLSVSPARRSRRQSRASFYGAMHYLKLFLINATL